MFKRANKITALLVAAASVMSIVPAMAADTTRLGTNEGTIESAVAFKDGKYVYEGYRTDSDNKSIYYNAGDKDKELTNLSDADLNGAYSDKYAYAKDGSDEYLVDLTSGSVIDDQTPEDDADTAATKLKSNLKKTSRYDDAITVDSTTDLTALGGAKFGETWYQYGVTTGASDAAFNLVGSTGKLFGYTNAAGKYIDASNVANVYAYSSAKDKVVKIDEFSDTANDEDSDTKLQATLLDKPEFIAQDKDYIYQKVNVKITDTHATATSTATAAKGTVNWPSANSAAFKDTAAVYTVDFTGISYNAAFAAGPVKVGGHNFVFNGVAGATLAIDEYKDLATLKTAVNNYFAIAANVPAGFKYTTGGVFTATTAGTTGATLPAGETVTNITTAAADAGITIAGRPFVFNGTAGATLAAGEYKDLATLKAAVNTEFATTPITGFQYNAGVFTALTSQELTTTTTPTLAATTANLKDAENVTFVNGTDAGVSSTGTTRTATYIQKISKVQGDTKDDAYLPKTVASYELSKDYYDNGDGDTAYDVDAAKTSYQVTNGTLYTIKNTGSNVEVHTMNLKKDKVKFDASNLPASHLDINDKVDVYLVEEGDDDNTDINSLAGVSVDVDGNIWAINEGKIYKFVNGSFAEQFTCDRSMDSLDVYNATSLVAWDSAGDVYTTVNEGTKVTQGEATAVAPVVVTGWVKGTDGTWTFNDATGAKVVSKWINVGGSWYFLKADGIMATGWYNDNGTWYYLNGSGAMATGWINDGGSWYYLAGSGAMLANTTVDGYTLGASGAWVK